MASLHLACPDSPAPGSGRSDCSGQRSFGASASTEPGEGKETTLENRHGLVAMEGGSSSRNSWPQPFPSSGFFGPCWNDSVSLEGGPMRCRQTVEYLLTILYL